MKEIKIPTYSLKTKYEGSRKYVFDVVRKKYVVLTPEEFVRQNFIRFIISELNFPLSLISVELPVKFHGLKKRCDILLNNRNGEPLMLVECKAPGVKITQDVVDQIVIYNQSLNVQYLIITNGDRTLCLLRDPENGKYIIIHHIPPYNNLVSQE